MSILNTVNFNHCTDHNLKQNSSLIYESNSKGEFHLNLLISKDKNSIESESKMDYDEFFTNEWQKTEDPKCSLTKEVYQNWILDYGKIK